MTEAKAILAAQAIVDDITDRSGLGNEWDLIDKTTQREIKAKWAEIIATTFK